VAQFQIECIESKTNTDRSQYSQFVLEPLERGQGITVGNALRRVLLANLSGAAVTAVRIAGVNHEFATLEGVREDVLEILLNMKEIAVRAHSEGPHLGRMVAHGPGTATAAQFELPSEVEVVNPDRPVATLSEGAKLEMEFQIERGSGYRTVERTQDEGSALDFLQIDAAFMPIRKANYSVEDTRARDPNTDGSVTKDRLLLDITTDGSISPEEALSQAAGIAVGLFEPLRDLRLESLQQEASGSADSTGQIPIEELQLSVRAYNCLKRAQINSVADLLDYSHEDLLEIKNFGQKSAEEVLEALQQRLGITLPQEKSASQ